MSYIGSKPANKPITSADIEDSIIVAADLAANSVDSSELVDGGIDTSHLSADAVTAAKLADDAVVTANIVDLNVTTAKIAADAITGAKIADDAIGAEHIDDNAIGLAALASGTDGNIISYDASGNPVAVATGNSGQLLTSAGAGAPPTFTTVSGFSVTSITGATDLAANTVPATGDTFIINDTSASALRELTYANLRGASFYANNNAEQTIGNATNTTLNYALERWDSHSYYDGSYRFVIGDSGMAGRYIFIWGGGLSESGGYSHDAYCNVSCIYQNTSSTEQRRGTFNATYGHGEGTYLHASIMFDMDTSNDKVLCEINHGHTEREWRAVHAQFGGFKIGGV